MTSGKQEGKVLEIKLSQFVIGRDPQCHLRPASPLISKRHCAILQRDGKAFLRDFDSTNGSFVNDQPVKGEVELHDKDRLKIGPLLFTVVLQAGTPVNRATPAPPTKTTGVKSDSAGKTAATDDQTPPPATKGKKDEAEDDIAAMLLELGDESTSGALTSGAGDGVPDGSTVMELPSVGDQPGGEKKEDKEKAKSVGNTSNAAKAILEKYMRRPRS
jgi:pSer/pThr/pTyr-binding forkhead associated (FHA) protein